jgi:hypothetical protein
MTPKKRMEKVRMTSLSGQNRSRILESLSILKRSLSDKEESTDKLSIRVSNLFTTVKSLDESLSHKPISEESVDETFAEEFIGSGAFSDELASMKETEGAQWGSAGDCREC